MAASLVSPGRKVATHDFEQSASRLVWVADSDTVGGEPFGNWLPHSAATTVRITCKYSLNNNIERGTSLDKRSIVDDRV